MQHTLATGSTFISFLIKINPVWIPSTNPTNSSRLRTSPVWQTLLVLLSYTCGFPAAWRSLLMPRALSTCSLFPWALNRPQKFAQLIRGRQKCSKVTTPVNNSLSVREDGRPHTPCLCPWWDNSEVSANFLHKVPQN